MRYTLLFFRYLMLSILKMKKLILVILLVFWLWIIFPQSFAYDTSNKNQGKVFTHKLVDTSIPDRFKPSDNKDIAYRLKVLPYEEYRYHNQYIVIPKMWLVAPIMEAEKWSDDYKNALKGKNFDYNKYLVWGPTIYPWTAPIGTQWNTFIFGHSNYRIDRPGKFKTIFRLTYNLEVGDKIWVYKKIGWKWVFFEYSTTISQLIGAKETWVLLPEKDKITISLSACRPIGTAQKRRFNRAELTYIEELDKVLNPPKVLAKPKWTKIKKMRRKSTAVLWSGTLYTWTVTK